MRTPTKKDNASKADATEKAQSPPEEHSGEKTEKMPVGGDATHNDTYSIETHEPKQKYKNRLIEAKACVTKAKLHLENSRNKNHNKNRSN